MNMMLSTAEIEKISTDSPVVVMTRREKLLRWAKLVRESTKDYHIYHGLEYQSPEALRQMYVQKDHPTAFALALNDPILQDAGFDSTKTVSIADTMQFFELSQEQLHEFSCDCGGSISNRQMADRIEKLAGPVPPAATVVDSATWTGRAA